MFCHGGRLPAVFAWRPPSGIRAGFVGATALIAVIGGEKIHNLGFMYAVFPVGGGALIMLVVALLVNNIPKQRHYPEFWV